MNSRDPQRNTNPASNGGLAPANHGGLSHDGSSGYAALEVQALIEHKGAPQSSGSPKIVLYSHDVFGMGNIRRTLLLAQEFLAQYPQASILIITGSPVIRAFRIPEGVDYIKLPGRDDAEAEYYAEYRSLSR